MGPAHIVPPEVGRLHPPGSAQPVPSVLIANRTETGSETPPESRKAKSVLSVRSSKRRGLPVHRAPSFRRYTRRVSLAVLFLAYPLAAAAQSLQGWGPYTFGLSRSDVISKSDGIGQVLLPGKGGPDLLGSARINEQLYTVEFYLRGADPRLWKIQLHAELSGRKMDKDGCRAFFEKIAGDLKKKYGGMEHKTAKAPVFGQITSYEKRVGDVTINISESYSDRCDVNVTYEAPPLKPIEGSF
jgi:hypothetical protein